MKKLLVLLFLPIIALMTMTGCGESKNMEEFKKQYENLTKVYIVEGENIFFSDVSAPNTLSIAYSDDIQNAVDNEYPNTDLQKKYRAFHYQQEILNTIFNFYEDNKEEFYNKMSSADFKEKEVENVSAKLIALKDCLVDFSKTYEMFTESTKDGLSDVLQTNIKNYTFELNRVIEKSFDFMYSFANLYEKYCIEDINLINKTVLNYKIDRAYLNIAHVIYLENFNAFNRAVGEDMGICNMSDVVGSNNKFNLLSHLKDTKNISEDIITNLDVSSENYIGTIGLVNDFNYAYKLFDQQYSHYESIYNLVDIYTISQYKFDLMGGSSFDSYINSLNVSDRANVNLLTNFVDECYTNLVTKLNLIIE